MEATRGAGCIRNVRVPASFFSLFIQAMFEILRALRPREDVVEGIVVILGPASSWYVAGSSRRSPYGTRIGSEQRLLHRLLGPATMNSCEHGRECGRRATLSCLRRL
jgi:hypothetical protein